MFRNERPSLYLTETRAQRLTTDLFWQLLDEHLLDDFDDEQTTGNDCRNRLGRLAWRPRRLTISVFTHDWRQTMVDCSTLAGPRPPTVNGRFSEVYLAFTAVDALLPNTSDRIWYRSVPLDFRNKRIVKFRVDLLSGLLILTIDPKQFDSN
jgi:hypothetical protein